MKHPRPARRVRAGSRPVASARAAVFCGCALLLTAALNPLPVMCVGGYTPLLLAGDDTKTGGGPG